MEDASVAQILDEYNEELVKEHSQGLAKPDMIAYTKQGESIQSPKAYGQMSNILPGRAFKNRGEMAILNLHSKMMAGIDSVAADTLGAYAIVMSGGYKDDIDAGEEFWYTGEGGQKGGQQSTVSLKRAMLDDVVFPVRKIARTDDAAFCPNQLLPLSMLLTMDCNGIAVSSEQQFYSFTDDIQDLGDITDELVSEQVLDRSTPQFVEPASQTAWAHPSQLQSQAQEGLNTTGCTANESVRVTTVPWHVVTPAMLPVSNVRKDSAILGGSSHGYTTMQQQQQKTAISAAISKLSTLGSGAEAAVPGSGGQSGRSSEQDTSAGLGSREEAGGAASQYEGGAVKMRLTFSPASLFPPPSSASEVVVSQAKQLSFGGQLSLGSLLLTASLKDSVNAQASRHSSGSDVLDTVQQLEKRRRSPLSLSRCSSSPPPAPISPSGPMPPLASMLSAGASDLQRAHSEEPQEVLDNLKLSMSDKLRQLDLMLAAVKAAEAQANLEPEPKAPEVPDPIPTSLALPSLRTAGPPLGPGASGSGHVMIAPTPVLKRHRLHTSPLPTLSRGGSVPILSSRVGKSAGNSLSQDSKGLNALNLTPRNAPARAESCSIPGICSIGTTSEPKRGCHSQLPVSGVSQTAVRAGPSVPSKPKAEGSAIAGAHATKNSNHSSSARPMAKANSRTAAARGVVAQGNEGASSVGLASKSLNSQPLKTMSTRGSKRQVSSKYQRQSANGCTGVKIASHKMVIGSQKTNSSCHVVASAPARQSSGKASARKLGSEAEVAASSGPAAPSTPALMDPQPFSRNSANAFVIA